jgi:hypothetical protein
VFCVSAQESSLPQAGSALLDFDANKTACGASGNPANPFSGQYSTEHSPQGSYNSDFTRRFGRFGCAKLLLGSLHLT